MKRLSKKGSRSCCKIAVDTAVLFSSFHQKNSLEALLFEWCKNGEIEISVSDYSVEELTLALNVSPERLSDFLLNSKARIVSDTKSRKDPSYMTYVQEAKELPDVADRPVFIFAKIFLRDTPDGFFISGDREFMKFKDRLDNRVKTLKEFIKEML